MKTVSDIISDNLPFVVRTLSGEFYWSTASEGVALINQFSDTNEDNPRNDWINKYYSAVSLSRYLTSSYDSRINCHPIDSDDFYEWCITRPHLVLDCQRIRYNDDYNWNMENFSTIEK